MHLLLKKRLLLGGAVLSGCVLIGVAVAYYTIMQAKAAPLPLTLIDANCALDKRACTVQGQQGEQLTLSVLPKPIPVLKDVQVTLQNVQGLGQLKQAEVTVEGVDMFMGYQSASLQATAKAPWQGTFVLPICSSNVMQWQLILDLQTTSGHYQAVFPFQTYGQ